MKGISSSRIRRVSLPFRLSASWIIFPSLNSSNLMTLTASPALTASLAFVALLTLTCSSMNHDILPPKLGAWTLSSDTIYTPENLYDYIDGGAELYLSYGFRKVLSKTYIADNQPNITVDIFDMNTPGDAYGVFMNSAEGVSDLVGQGTQYNQGFMLFWMDHYFISIMAWPETPESKDAIMKIARIIEKGIGKTGDLPRVLDYLPEEGLDPLSIRYFHHYAWMNTHYYIAGENILLIGDDTGAVLARYGGKEHPGVLLVIEYPSGEKATEASESFIRNYLPELEGKRSMQVEDGTWTGIEKLENILILVFNAPGDKEIGELTGSVKAKIRSEQQ
jgi:hypothetical protein